MDQFRLMARPVPLVEDLIQCVARLVQEVAGAAGWPSGLPRADERGEDDPRNWARFAPTIEVVNLLYGIDMSGSGPLDR